MTTIYKHQYIDRRDSFAGLGLFATKPIPAGTILSMDLVALGTRHELTDFLNGDNVKVRDKLYPRGLDKSHTLLKVDSNSFEGDPYALGEYLSYYNHSCTPNAAYGRHLIGRHFLYTVVAVKDIRKREEVRIFYGYGATHDPFSPHYVDCKGCIATEETFLEWNKVACRMIDNAQQIEIVKAWQKRGYTAVEKAILEKYQKPEYVAATLPF